MALYPLTNDPIVYRAIGILIAVLIGLALIPLDRRVRLEDRAARLEVWRLEAATRSMGTFWPTGTGCARNLPLRRGGSN
jgi:hypothetical protein